MRSSLLDLDMEGSGPRTFRLGGVTATCQTDLCTYYRFPARRNRLRSKLSVTDPKRPREPYLAGQASACRSPKSQGQVKQLSAVIWKRSLWVVNMLVNSRSVYIALPRHIIVSSRHCTAVLRCTSLSERIKCGPTEIQKLTPDEN